MMILTTKFNGKKTKNIFTDFSVNEYNNEVKKYLIEFQNNDKYDVITHNFRTTRNAKVINVFYDNKLLSQIVKSYDTYVLMCCKNSVSYTGFISNTTTKHIIRFFKEYCKFDFDYEDVRK